MCRYQFETQKRYSQTHSTNKYKHAQLNYHPLPLQSSCSWRQKADYSKVPKEKRNTASNTFPTT